MVASKVCTSFHTSDVSAVFSHVFIILRFVQNGCIAMIVIDHCMKLLSNATGSNSIASFGSSANRTRSQRQPWVRVKQPR